MQEWYHKIMNKGDFLQALDDRAQTQQEIDDKTAQIDAVKENGDKIVEALKGHTNDLTGSLHGLLMATLISKDPNIAETAKKLVSLLDGITKAGNDFSTSKIQSMPVAAEKLSNSVEKLAKVMAQQKDYTNHLEGIRKQVEKLDTRLSKFDANPTINVAPPDLSSLAKLLKPESTKPVSKTETKPTISLRDYAISDLFTAPDKTQYIGYISPNGSWYIVHSDEEKNSMRYHFGSGDYNQAWGEKYTLGYKILSEAARGI